MAALRFLAALFLLIATVALVADLTPSLSDGSGFSSTSLSRHWAKLAPSSLQAAKASLSKATAPWVWDEVVASVIDLPTWLLFGVLGLVCGYAGRHRRQINIFVN